MRLSPHISFWYAGTLHSYTQVFFSKNKWLGWLLILTTFFDPALGLSGLLAVWLANGLVLALGFDKTLIEEGSYGFNSLLVGLGMGLFFVPNAAFFVLLAVAVLFTVLITIGLGGVLAKYGLPYLSLPFLAGIWTVLLAGREFEALGLSEKGVYVLNELYAGGDIWLVNVYNWFNRSGWPEPLLVYLRSLGAILFQFNALSGLLMALGLLIYSRIAFSLSLLSFLAAWWFYRFIGADIDSLGYSYIGFNFILSGIAVGGFFLVPSKSAYGWALLLVLPMVMLTAALGSLFNLAQLGIYSLPFNLVVLAFLYVLKLRPRPDAKPEQVMLQLYSPEKNLYEKLSNSRRYANFKWAAIGLPFFGEWQVSQGPRGDYTHQGAWQDAWDFVVVDKEGRQYANRGDYREDYYCYGKPVLAPADGVVEEVTDGIEDNPIGDNNTLHNWGNSVVLRHGYRLYTQVSHLQAGTIRVKKGDTVRRGDVLARCGNSGRSPYPHLHFQVQRTPHTGSQTLKYPLSSYLVRHNGRLEFRFFDYPQTGEQLSTIETSRLLSSAFHFIPGRTLPFRIREGRSTREVAWEVRTDIYNHSYLYCTDTGAQAYFVNDGTLFYFTLYKGSRESLLYYFFLGAYKVLLGHYPGLTLREPYPLYLLAPGGWRWLHDFTAPFFSYMQAGYELRYPEEAGTGGRLTLESAARLSRWGRLSREWRFVFSLENGRFSRFEVHHAHLHIEAECIKE